MSSYLGWKSKLDRKITVRYTERTGHGLKRKWGPEAERRRSRRSGKMFSACVREDEMVYFMFMFPCIIIYSMK